VDQTGLEQVLLRSSRAARYHAHHCRASSGYDLLSRRHCGLAVASQAVMTIGPPLHNGCNGRPESLPCWFALGAGARFDPTASWSRGIRCVSGELAGNIIAIVVPCFHRLGPRVMTSGSVVLRLTAPERDAWTKRVSSKFCCAARVRRGTTLFSLVVQSFHRLRPPVLTSGADVLEATVSARRRTAGCEVGKDGARGGAGPGGLPRPARRRGGAGCGGAGAAERESSGAASRRRRGLAVAGVTEAWGGESVAEEKSKSHAPRRTIRVETFHYPI
jgi:hypothetical protein